MPNCHDKGTSQAASKFFLPVRLISWGKRKGEESVGVRRLEGVHRPMLDSIYDFSWMLGQMFLNSTFAH